LEADRGKAKVDFKQWTLLAFLTLAFIFNNKFKRLVLVFASHWIDFVKLNDMVDEVIVAHHRLAV
jgi:hypothetical protein